MFQSISSNGCVRYEGSENSCDRIIDASICSVITDSSDNELFCEEKRCRRKGREKAENAPNRHKAQSSINNQLYSEKSVSIIRMRMDPMNANDK